MIGALALTAGVSLALGYALGSDRTVEETTIERQCRCGGDEWNLWVEGTNDKHTYRGIYESVTGSRYVAEGNGIANTLENLSDKVENMESENRVRDSATVVR
jgi:hypothetical protein